jgi:pyridoxine/pyridoxamine 5'-phosphate oxidase
MANALNSALSDRMPCLVATASKDGMPDLSYRGSVMVYDSEHLAFWERTKGESLKNLEENPQVAMLYTNTQTRAQWRFYSTAQVLKEGQVRDEIMERTNPFELSRDPERTGYAILIRVDRVRSGREVIMQREG